MEKTKCISTRWANKCSLETAIKTSQPIDWGLFVPEKWPSFSSDKINSMSSLSYQDLAKMVLWKFDFWIPSNELNAIIDSAYWSQWESKDITPLVPMWNNNFLLELYRWPTLAFKDVALQFFPRLLQNQQYSNWKTLRAVWASSGDTISAAHYWVWWMKNMQSIFVLPEYWPSHIQRLQSTANWFNNVMTILLENWTFDDGQAAVKQIMSTDKYREYKETNGIISFNSINIARILAQIVYYFKAYWSLINQWIINNWDEVNFSVPSWNFGDSLAWYYAKEMWLPIASINVATNKNNILHHFLTTGEYHPSSRSKISLAPSQDITVASNFERMLFAKIKDPERIQQLMQDLKKQWYFKVTDQELGLFNDLKSSTASDNEIVWTIMKIYNEARLYIDWHTATWVKWAFDVFSRYPSIPTICLATADQVKFKDELTQRGVAIDETRREAKTLELLERDERLISCSENNPEEIINKIQNAIRILNNWIGLADYSA